MPAHRESKAATSVLPFRHFLNFGVFVVFWLHNEQSSFFSAGRLTDVSQ